MSGSSFWQMIRRWRWLFLSVAIALCAIRLTQFQFYAPNYLIAIESNCWIIAVFAFAYRYLNRPGNALNYLSQAAYPIYILHMLFLYVGSMLIFPLAVPVALQFVLLLAFTIGGCFLTYEYIVRRVNFLRPLFGLKVKRTQLETAMS
jgi:membrane-bound acyltransferase YfiQ involved in biofilm formation